MFINRIYRHARENPDHLAVINSGEEITYCRFANTIEVVRNHLMRAGLPKDGIIVKITSNLYHDWVLLLAARSLGLTTVAGTSWQAVEGLGLKNITGLLCLSDEAEAMEAFQGARPDCAVVQVPRRMMAGTGNGPAPLPLSPSRFGDHIDYTSGTTGSYKKVLHQGDRFHEVVESEGIADSGKIEPEDIYFLYSFGPWTAAGHRLAMNCWFCGSTVMFEQRQDWFKYFCDYPITLTFFVPGLLEMARANIVYRPSGPRKLKILVGGGFLDAQLARTVIDQFDCELLLAYGGTEFRTSLETWFRNDEDVVWLAPNINSGFEIVDEDDQPVPTGIEGIVRIKSEPCYPFEYIDDLEATAKHFRDGYFYPGDMAVQRADGRIRILGRVDDVLNLVGQKIAIEPFEDAVRKTLKVENVCVFSQQDDKGNDMILIVIEGDRLPEQGMLDTLASKIKRVPKIRYELMRQFPRGDNGMMKVNRRKVLELVRASTAN
jgi:acyl-coenzyme A synthetase/AMP-(fatty) acid ligase